jgi:small GTP-binding protein
MSSARIVRLTLAGSERSGKTALLGRYVGEEFQSEYMPTIGVDFRLKNLVLDSQAVKMQGWDLAGQERFATITNNYFRGAHGSIVTCDLSRASEMEAVRAHVARFRDYCVKGTPILIAGTKADLGREIAKNEGEALADELGCFYAETSALGGGGVDEAFERLIRLALARKEETPAAPRVDPHAMCRHSPSGSSSWQLPLLEVDPLSPRELFLTLLMAVMCLSDTTVLPRLALFLWGAAIIHSIRRM